MTGGLPARPCTAPRQICIGMTLKVTVQNRGLNTLWMKKKLMWIFTPNNAVKAQVLRVFFLLLLALIFLPPSKHLRTFLWYKLTCASHLEPKARFCPCFAYISVNWVPNLVIQKRNVGVVFDRATKASVRFLNGSFLFLQAHCSCRPSQTRPTLSSSWSLGLYHLFSISLSSTRQCHSPLLTHRCDHSSTWNLQWLPSVHKMKVEGIGMA